MSDRLISPKRRSQAVINVLSSGIYTGRNKGIDPQLYLDYYQIVFLRLNPQVQGP
jgi:hypothetical protein